MKERNFPVGLLVKVEKSGGDSNQSAIRGLAIGYYDNVSIQPVEEWFDFSPDHLHKGDDGGTYMMKLCCPSKDVRDQLEEQGVCYNRWVNDLETLVDENPCVSVVLVNLMDSFKYQNDGNSRSDLFSDILLKLVDLLELPAEELQAASCCILPSLGYSDYGILFAEKSWSLALKLMSRLHKIKDSGGQPILSTDYSIPAYFSKKIPETGSLLPKNVQLASRLTLKPGFTPEHIAYVVQGQDIQVFEINDTADCLLISEAHPEHLLGNLLQIRGILPRDGGSLCDMVISSKSRFHQKVETTASNDVVILPESDISYLNELTTILRQYRQRLKQLGLNLRQSNALLETASSLQQICAQPHNKDLREALEPLVHAFSFCMNAVNQELASADRPEKSRSGIREGLDLTLDIFRDRVSGFVSDLTRSDCFSMEREQYNHPSVGSGTMLLLGLNRLINELSKEIQQSSGYKACEHGFLLTTGGCDTTLTHRMFDFLQPDEFDENDDPVESLPFVMQVAEIGLFDISSTMLRLVHEIMHACGDRHRKARSLLILKFICISLGKSIAEAILQADVEQLEKLYGESGVASTADYGVVLQRYRSLFSDTLGDILQKELKQRWDSEKIFQAELQISYNYMAWLQDTLNQLFEEASNAFRLPETEMKQLPMAKKLLESTLDIKAHLWRDWAQLWNREFEVCYSPCNQSFEKYNYWLGLAADPQPQYLAFYWVLQDISVLLSHCARRCHDLAEDVVYIFTESFSDFSAQSILGAHWVDFLLCFLMENGSVDQVMPDSALNQFRIPFVLRSIYGLSGYLSDVDNMELLQKAVKALQDRHASISSDTVSALAKRVDGLLQQYDQPKIAPLSSLLVEYWHECDDSLRTYEKFNRRYRAMFQRFSSLRSSDSSDDVISILRTLSSPDSMPEPVAV